MPDRCGCRHLARVLEEPASAEELLNRAIARRLLVNATYNRGTATLAPHSLFTRHGDMFLRAVRVEYDGRKPAEPRLGTFKLAGLREITLTRKLFSPRSLFAGLDEQAPAEAQP